MASNLPAVIDINTFALFQNGSEAVTEMAEAIHENLLGGTLSLRHLTRIKTPSGGATVFQIPTADGPKNAEALRGVIVVQEPRRVLYLKSMSEADSENNRPDCYSNDAKVGIGVRWPNDTMEEHDCFACPMAAWQTGPGGERIKPRCAERRHVFLLQEGDMMPVLLDLPPTSLKQVDSYMASLITSGLSYPFAITEVACKQELQRGSKNQYYTEITFKKVGEVPRELRPQIREYQAAIKALVNRPQPNVSFAADMGADPSGEMEDIDLT